MKKFVSLILTVCFIFLAANVIWPADVQSEEKTGTILSLASVSDFTSKLESENVDIADLPFIVSHKFTTEIEKSIDKSTILLLVINFTFHKMRSSGFA